jgi:hypothetical protein
LPGTVSGVSLAVVLTLRSLQDSGFILTVGQTTLEPADRGLANEPLPALQLTLNVALWVVGAAVVAGWLTLGALHVRDDYHVSHTQGVWIAVSEAARAGQLYPPIFDGVHYAGTRYMPLPILSNALAAGLVGDPLVGGKLLAAILMAALLTLVVWVLRGLACRWPLAVALAAVVVGTSAGLHAGTTIGGDLLPAVLQTAALGVALRSRERKAILLAGVLAGLAVASKLTGVWALVAITTWLVFQREGRRAGTFAVAGAFTAAVVLGTIQMFTHGGLSQHLLAFSVAGIHSTSSVLRGPNQVLYNLIGFASGALVLVPLAVLGALLTRGWRQLSVIHLALGYVLLVLLGVYADVGTGPNQLVDFIVLTVLAAGHLGARSAPSADRRQGTIAFWAVVVAVLWAASLDLVRTIGFDLRSSVASLESGDVRPRAAAAVASMVRPGEEILAEDPSVWLALGRRPLVMDPFMVMRLDRADPRRVDPLISWISGRRFQFVILLVPLENRDQDFWWTDFHFGPRVANAIRASYRFDRIVGRYYVYRPKPTAPARSLVTPTDLGDQARGETAGGVRDGHTEPTL